MKLIENIFNMKPYCFIVLFIMNTQMFAQLSVRNNAYVFVNNQIVFVEDNINLNETNSRVYLRNEAQIIQGSGATGNSGIGELSVYQEGNVGEYEYNYWCSPIGSKTNNTINNPFGIALLNDVVDITTSTPATFVHSGSYNGTSSPLNIEPYWIWKYIAGSNYSDWIHIQSSTSINPGEGFTMKGTAGSSNVQRYDFRGKPNNGTIGVNVLTNQFTLTGNPYPSAIDAVAYIHDPENVTAITGTLYYWEQNPSINSHYLKDYEGGYATYTIDATGTVEVFIPAVFNTYKGDGTINIGNMGSGIKTAKRYIPIGQGFMVEGTTSGTVKAKNSHRVYVKENTANSEFFKATGTKKKSEIIEIGDGFSVVPKDYKRFRLNIDFNNTYTRQIVATFHPGATYGFDYGLEIKTNLNELLSTDACFTLDNLTFLAEALPYNEFLKIPINIKVSKNIPIRIRITDIQNFNSDQPIYVHDVITGLFMDLRKQDFNINLETGDYANRFEIVFSKSTLSTEASIIKDLKAFQDNSLSQLTILNPNALKINTLWLYDITGKQVLHKEMETNTTISTHSTKFLSNGIYILKISIENNHVFSTKVLIVN